MLFFVDMGSVSSMICPRVVVSLNVMNSSVSEWLNPQGIICDGSILTLNLGGIEERLYRTCEPENP